jgi:[ribosomal protein S5]-alanine N-acetyltransferase
VRHFILHVRRAAYVSAPPLNCGVSRTMIEPPANWETERLALRPAVVADAPSAFETYTANPEVSRYMTWRPHHSVAETERFFRRCEEVWAKRLAFPWSLQLKSDGSFAGMLEARAKQHSIDIGYVLAPRLWRRGLMSEAVGGLVEWAMEKPEIHRVWAVCDAENVASARLLESVGMQFEGKLRRWLVHPNVSDSPRDCLCYAIVRPAG